MQDDRYKRLERNQVKLNQKLDRNYRLLKIAIGGGAGLLILVASGFNIKGKVHDSEFEYNLSIADISQLIAAIGTSGGAVWALNKKMNGEDDEDFEIESEPDSVKDSPTTLPQE